MGYRFEPPSEPRKPSKLELAAYREAGYFVAALLSETCPTPRRVTIGSDAPKRRSVGHVSPTLSPDSEVETQRRLDRIVCLLAGGIAVRRFAGRADHNAAEYRAASALALKASGDKDRASAMLRVADLIAAHLFLGRWPAVEALAAALLKRETLTREEARQIVEAEPDLHDGATL